VSSSEDRTRLARIFNMSDVAVQTVKMVRALAVAFKDTFYIFNNSKFVIAVFRVNFLNVIFKH